MPLLNILLKLLFIERKIEILSKNMITRDYEIGETRFCSLCLRLVAKAVNQPHREPVEKLHSCYVKVGIHCCMESYPIVNLEKSESDYLN